ncbi:MAG: hydroxyethylthiazole kinase [Desulfobacterales bacterium]
MRAYTWKLLNRIRETSPLIHNITNYVVMNSSANILLALGAAPVMAHSLAEIDEMTGMADGLVLNIGTIEEEWVPSMIRAAKIANQTNIPVVLDPVGAGATLYRKQVVSRILNEVSVSVIRGNASEIFSLTSSGVKTRGVDSSISMSEEIAETARRIAADYDCIVGVSGREDLVTDGEKMIRIRNGQALMARVTGIGCGLSAVTAAFCAAAEEKRRAIAAAAAFAYYGLCGDLAVKFHDKPGSFYVAFLDALYSASRDDIYSLLEVEPAEL